MFIWGFPADLNWFQLGVVAVARRVYKGEEAEGGSKRAGGSGLGGWPPVQMISPDSCVLQEGEGGRGGSVREEDGMGACVCVCEADGGLTEN